MECPRDAASNAYAAEAKRNSDYQNWDIANAWADAIGDCQAHCAVDWPARARAAEAWRAKVEPLIEAVRVANRAVVAECGIGCVDADLEAAQSRRLRAVLALLDATSKPESEGGATP